MAAAPLMPSAALGDQNEEVAVAIYFQGADGKIEPELFHDAKAPLLRWSCEARLDYLTKKFYRTIRSNVELRAKLEDKQAVRSSCVKLDK